MSQFTVHGTTVAVGDDGVLLIGPSGVGKSDLALRLMDDGGVLVADDRTLTEVRAGRVLAAAPASIAGRIEAWGLGIFQVPHRAEVVLSLVVALGPFDERLPSAPETHDIDGVMLPLVRIDPRLASAPALVRLALRARRIAP